MTYEELQASWYDFLSTGLLKIAALFLLILVIRVLLNNKMIFKVVAFALFIIPISIIGVLKFIKG